MTRYPRVIFATAGLAVALSAAAVLAQTPELQSLRGAAPIEENSRAPEVSRQTTDDGRFERAFRQQPPLIPHDIDKYQINLKVNQCMRCHDWPYNVDEGAPKISETHYTNRDGISLDHVARTRWFCTQCHVPQANTRALVDNEFKSAVEVE